jgi:hypothetical protein
MVQRSPARKLVHKKAQELNKLIQETYVFNLETYYIPQIQNIILEEYDIELTGQVTDRKARTNPIYYREEFEEALINFEWIDINAGATKLTVPETDTFNWDQGTLRIIENILEGAMGTFVEVDEEQYVAMYSKRPIIQPFDKAVPLKKRIYIIRLTGDVRRRWRLAYPKNEIVRYPFSNQPPIDIFGPANKYVEENIKSWIDEAIKEATKEIAK